MKAIYINLDPYLAALAAWLKGGKSGDPPKFDPLPLAVTIPLGETAAIYCPGNTDGEGAHFRVDGKSMYASATGSFDPSGDGPFVATNVSPGLSIYPATESMGQKYAIAAVSSDTLEISIRVQDANEDGVTITFPVLVRRETASGPVDLVDFTPPAAAPTAAQINTALGGTGAVEGRPLAGVLLNETKWLRDGETEPSSIFETAAVSSENPALGVTTPGS